MHKSCSSNNLVNSGGISLINTNLDGQNIEHKLSILNYIKIIESLILKFDKWCLDKFETVVCMSIWVVSYRKTLISDGFVKDQIRTLDRTTGYMQEDTGIETFQTAQTFISEFKLDSIITSLMIWKESTCYTLLILFKKKLY